jgi:hypothetical protein
MFRKSIVSVIVPIILLLALAPTVETSAQSSHVVANVPDAKDFQTFLKRDLLAFFRAQGATDATTVDYQLLREEATQSGVSFPKFYAWVSVNSGDSIVAEGAVRLAAIERTHFSVTHFVAKSKAIESRALVESIFPKPLIDAILDLASSE